jgi:hypothetical protein
MAGTAMIKMTMAIIATTRAEVGKRVTMALTDTETSRGHPPERAEIERLGSGGCWKEG